MPTFSPDHRAAIRLSVAYNFDPTLADRLAALAATKPQAEIVDVFGALPGGPVPSARPESRIRDLSWTEFSRQVSALRTAGIGFNYLLNTQVALDSGTKIAIRDYCRRLFDAGVTSVTVGHEDMVAEVKSAVPELIAVVSITRGLRTPADIAMVEAKGADAAYVDPTVANRDFGLLRSILGSSGIPIRLYANVSCISACPVARRHYQLFGLQRRKASAAAMNDRYFLGCSLVKLLSPIEWIQMPWIRPEDIRSYAVEGISQFKLSDRLAPTDVILRIARSYCDLKSPDDLFELIERDGTKYRMLGASEPPIRVVASSIPSSFLDHFRSGQCISQDRSCVYCRTVAGSAVSSIPLAEMNVDIEEAVLQVPRSLRLRAEVARRL